MQSKTAFSDNIATQIGAGQVIVNGVVTVNDWRTAGQTTIDGGQITADSVTATQVNFAVADSTNIVATINASSEGIEISGGLISISGSTTFDSGYDPTEKTDKVGGTYDSAAAGARVRVFPDADTGILITDGTNDVFKALVGGTDVGDVIIGDYAGGKGIKWDKSTTTLSIAGTLETSTLPTGNTLTVVGNIESTGFTALVGWRIWGNGNASFHDLSIGGDVGCITLASTGTVSANVISSATIFQFSTDYNSNALRSIYSDDGVRLIWRDKNNGVHILT